MCEEWKKASNELMKVKEMKMKKIWNIENYY